MAINNSINAPVVFTPAKGGTGTNISNANVNLEIGGTPPAYWQGATLSILNNNAASPSFAGYPVSIVVDTSTSNTNSGLYFSAYTGTVGINMANYNVNASRGSMVAPTKILSGDTLFALDVSGQFGTAIENVQYVSSIRAVAEGNFNSSTDHPIGLRFYTSNTGDALPVERAKIDKTGLLTASYGISSTALTLTTTPLAIGSGGTGQVTAIAGFDALSPVTTSGDISYRGNSSNIRLAGGTINQVLTVLDATPGAMVLGWASPNVGTATGVTTTTTVSTAGAITGAKIFLSLVAVAGTPTTASSVLANNIVNGVSFDIVATLGAGATSVDVNWCILR